MAKAGDDVGVVEAAGAGVEEADGLPKHAPYAGWQPTPQYGAVVPQ